MSLPRHTFRTGDLDCDFGLEMPIGFYPPESPPADADFVDPLSLRTLMAQDSPMVESAIAVLGRPAPQGGSLADWLHTAAQARGITLASCEAGQVGGLLCWHPALLATGTQPGNMSSLKVSLVLLEDGGRLLMGYASAAQEIADDYLPTLEHCIRTLELTESRGPTLPLQGQGNAPEAKKIEHDPDLPPPRDAREVWVRDLARKRSAAVAQAAPLLAAGRYDDVERLVQQADTTVQGPVALGRMYTQALRELVESGGHRRDRTVAEALFKRALHWKLSTYPDPHTAFEAKDYEAGQRKDLAELVQILGYDPTR